MVFEGGPKGRGGGESCPIELMPSGGTSLSRTRRRRPMEGPTNPAAKSVPGKGRFKKIVRNDRFGGKGGEKKKRKENLVSLKGKETG